MTHRRPGGTSTALRREIRLYHDLRLSLHRRLRRRRHADGDADELLETLALVRGLSPDPRDVDRDQPQSSAIDVALQRYRDAGVTRLSVGVQSFDDGLLAQHGPRWRSTAAGTSSASGWPRRTEVFPTLNVDMIFNLPGQSLAMLETRPRDAARAAGRPGVVLSADDRADRASQDGKEHGSQRPGLRHDMYERILDRLHAASTAPRPHGASRAGATACIDEYIVDQEDYVGRRQRRFQLRERCDVLDHVLDESVPPPRRGRPERHHPAASSSTLKERMRYDFLVRLFGRELPRDYLRRKLRARVLAADGARVARDAAGRRDAPRCGRYPPHAAAACTAGC